ncbi:hypothetical protein [Microbacterium testaceum]|nr:hypothetical protein [Microbacterium testaceum]
MPPSCAVGADADGLETASGRHVGVSLQAGCQRVAVSAAAAIEQSAP